MLSAAATPPCPSRAQTQVRSYTGSHLPSDEAEAGPELQRDRPEGALIVNAHSTSQQM